MPALSALLPGAVLAQASPQSYLGLGAGVIGLQLKELSQGITEVEESGLLPFAELSLGTQLASHFYLQGSVATSSGEVDYEGQTQLGRPLVTHTDYMLERYELIAGRHLGRSRLFAGVAYDVSDRVIRRVPGIIENEYREDQRKIDVFVGFQTTMAEANNRHLAFELQLAGSVQSELEVAFATDYDPVALDLEPTYGLSVRFIWTRDLLNDWSVSVSPEAFYSRMNQSSEVALYSNGMPSGRLLSQQETEQSGFVLGISLYRHF